MLHLFIFLFSIDLFILYSFVFFIILVSLSTIRIFFIMLRTFFSVFDVIRTLRLRIGIFIIQHLLLFDSINSLISYSMFPVRIFFVSTVKFVLYEGPHFLLACFLYSWLCWHILGYSKIIRN